MNYGLKECNKYFIKEREDTIIRGLSFTQFKLKPIGELKQYEQRYLNKYEDTEAIRKKLYSLYYSSISNFRPSNAIRLYEIAKTKVVLDPCAGWGGDVLAL
jgi:hypothetical protein